MVHSIKQLNKHGEEEGMTIDERRQTFEEFGLTEADEPAYELFIKFFKVYWKESLFKLRKELESNQMGEIEQ